MIRLNVQRAIATGMKFIAAILLLSSCAKSAPVGTIPTGPLTQDRIIFEYAIYLLAPPQSDPVTQLKQLLQAKEFKNLTYLTELNKEKLPATPAVFPRIIDDVAKEYRPPDIQSLRHFGRGLSSEQATALQHSTTAFVLVFTHRKEDVLSGLKNANRLMGLLADQTGGLIWDEEAREVFTAQSWQQKRIATWTEKFPVVSTQTTIHAYKNNDYVRAITLGMTKFGLPDVVIDDLPWSLGTPAGNLINLFCQALVEGQTASKPGEFELGVKQLQTQTIREMQLQLVSGKASGSVKLSLLQGKPEEGDPQNRLIQIKADFYPGADNHAKQEALITNLYGATAESAVSRIKHDDALLAASLRAKEQLPRLHNSFKVGLPPGEYIMVKAPFATPTGGQEWMWVEINDWKGNGQIAGQLKNEPVDIPNLHAGQDVKVQQDDIFDYIYVRANGSTEGNETSAIIQSMQGAK